MNVHQLNHTDSAEELVGSGGALAAMLWVNPAADRRQFDSFVDGVVELERHRSPERLTGACAPFAQALLADAFDRG